MNIDEAFSLMGDYYKSGNVREAERICKEVLMVYPTNVEFLCFLGEIYYQEENYDLSLEYFQKALHLHPAEASINYNIGNVLRKKGHADEAAAFYVKAVQINPILYEAYHNLGIIMMGKRQIDDAIRYFQEALKLNPNFFNSYYYLGIAFQGKGQLDEAIDCLKKTVQMNPTDYEAFDKLGIAFQEKGQLNEAITCFKKAVQLNPNFIDAYNDLGITLMEQGKNDEAIAAINKALDLKPNCFRTQLAKCMSQLHIIYPDQSSIEISRKRYEEELLKLKNVISIEEPQDIEAAAEAIGTVHPFYLTYQGLNDLNLQRIYGELTCKIMALRYPQLAQTPPMPSKIHNEPLRVGIISRFFYRHSVWKIPIKGLIENLDRKRFSLYGYFTGRKKDSETEIARSYFVRFIEDVYSFEQLCQTIRHDNLHVLIYPEIGMDHMTVKLAALRLAPIQCTSLGHPDTTGFPTIDYYLSSALMETPDADSHYTENLIRLPNLSFSYKPLEVPTFTTSREILGLPEKAVLYLCSQSLFKYLPQYDEVFPRIARNVSNCKFLFISNPSEYVTQQFRQRIKWIFDQWNINLNDYVLFLPRLDAGQYHGINLLCDIFLDSIGWSGNNTTFEAVACNLPIVTLPGTLMRARHCFAILRMMGLTETFATTVDEYIEIASQLGRNVQWRHDISEKIKTQKYRIYQDRQCITALEDFLVQEVEKKML